MSTDIGLKSVKIIKFCTSRCAFTSFMMMMMMILIIIIIIIITPYLYRHKHKVKVQNPTYMQIKETM